MHENVQADLFLEADRLSRFLASGMRHSRPACACPHHVGSPYDKDNAEWLLGKIKEWGLDAHIENFDVLFPTPKERVVELVEPSKFKASLQEPPVEGDPTSNQQVVTAPLVYVN